ncbi:MAG: DUF2933 domain-containing protein [Oligoflexales bacterium]
MQREGTQLPMQRLVIVAALAILAFYLITEHKAHLYGALPYILLLVCPLMHLFMHGGHNHAPSASDKEKAETKQGHKGCH